MYGLPRSSWDASPFGPWVFPLPPAIGDPSPNRPADPTNDAARADSPGSDGSAPQADAPPGGVPSVASGPPLVGVPEGPGAGSIGTVATGVTADPDRAEGQERDRAGRPGEDAGMAADGETSRGLMSSDVPHHRPPSLSPAAARIHRQAAANAPPCQSQQVGARRCIRAAGPGTRSTASATSCAAEPRSSPTSTRPDWRKRSPPTRPMSRSRSPGGAPSNCAQPTPPTASAMVGSSPSRSSPRSPPDRSRRSSAWARPSPDGAKHSWPTSRANARATVTPRRSTASSNSTDASPTAFATATTTGSACSSSTADSQAPTSGKESR